MVTLQIHVALALQAVKKDGATIELDYFGKHGQPTGDANVLIMSFRGNQHSAFASIGEAAKFRAEDSKIRRCADYVSFTEP